MPLPVQEETVMLAKIVFAQIAIAAIIGIANAALAQSSLTALSSLTLAFH
jgi:hypothetical protein